MNKLLSFILLVAATSTLLLGCSESDCPLTTTSYAHFYFLDGTTHNSIQFTGNIIVTGFINKDVVVTKVLPDGTTTEVIVKDSLINDTVFNNPQNSMSLPLSYTTKTTYVMHYTELMKDTIKVYHEPIPFVGNIDCKPMIFYTVERIEYTTNSLDSIVIVNPDINNEEKNNFKIFYTTGN
ncbi:MAG: DUF6452 family protein [Phocaeicola sp.]